MATIGIALGRPCLGITRESDLTAWRAGFTGHQVIPLELDSLDGLRQLWTCQGLVLISDGGYPEANLALTLASIVEWCRRGGVLAGVGGAPFLISQRPGGAVADPGAAADVTDRLVASNLEETGLRLTALGRELLGDGALPGTLVDLDLGSLLPLALYSPARPQEIAVATTDGSAVLSAERFGEGWWVTWGAAVQPRWAPAIRRGVTTLVERHLPDGPPPRPGIVLDPLRRRLDDGRDEVLGLGEFRSAELALVDQDTGETWPGAADADGVARFRLPAAAEPASLGVVHPGVTSSFTVVSPARVVGPPPSLATVEPDDFDAFWAEQLDRLGPPDFELAPLAGFGTEEFTGHRLRYRGASGLVTGVVTMPRSAQAAQPVPGVLTLPGYASSGLTSHLGELAGQAAIASLDVARARPADALRGRGPLCQEVADAERSGMILAALDAVAGYRVLAELCAGRPVAVHGHSQGGTLGLAVGALCPQARAVVAGVPFLVNLRHNLWRFRTDPYIELQWHLDRHPEQAEPALGTLARLDPRFLLKRLRQPCLLMLASDDDVAPGLELAPIATAHPEVALVVSEGGHIIPYLWELRRRAADFLGRALGLTPPESGR